MSHPVRALLLENGGIDATHCEGAAFQSLCAAERRRVGARDDAELARHLRQDEAALHAFVAQVAVPETWFFRYPMSFEALHAHLTGRDRPVRIASIGCATGQEAYTAAATALAALGPGGSVSVEAFDRNPVAIEVARRAQWTGSLALRASVPIWATPWIRIEPNGAWIHPHVKAAVSCTHVRSSAHMIEVLEGRTFDVVLCRNLLIYLDASTRDALVAAMVRAVPVGGLLMLGHAERVDLGPSWHRDDRPESFAWHRGALPPLVSPSPALERSSGPRASRDAARGAAEPIVLRPTMMDRQASASMASAESPTTAADGAVPHAAAQDTSLDRQVGSLFAHAETAMAAHDHVRALEILEQVIYLAPQHDLAMLALATVAERLGRFDEAKRWRTRAQRAAAHGRNAP
ncbi:MAG: tetratricopeptide repeat protein [Phycisphaerae bacterium]|nr:tetratricopeptide repeat protein [Phycisphaerae bacterium]